MKVRVISALLALIGLIGIGLQPAKGADEKPFAEQRFLLQISDPDPSKQTLVLNVANNLVNHYGPDKVDVEVVAFGPGLRLLLADNENSARIQGLVLNGVKFAACANTLQNFSKELGYRPEIHKDAKLVPAGIVEIGERVKAGFTLVKP